MQIFRHIDHLPDAARGTALAIGNFDGMHRGHQKVLAETRAIAGAMGVKTAVLTFEPHPREYFNPSQPPLRLYPLHAKYRLLKEAGVEILYLLRFNAEMAARSAELFTTEILASQLCVRHVLTGDNFVFGHKRGGDAALLKKQAAALGFGYTTVPGVVDEEGVPCSSSRIREALKAGDVETASRVLGHAYAITGRVRRGDARGRTIGFPTANIAMTRLFRPAYGVYAVRVRLPEGKMVNGVANLGLRPTVGGDTPLLEVHCFDFEGDLYGKWLEVQLVHYVRAEKKFASLEALKAQIAQDAAGARQILG